MSTATVDTASSKNYQSLTALLREAALLGATGHLLSWDQETKMPAGGSSYRADQLQLMATLEHERRTSTELGDLIASCEQDSALNADARVASNLREIRRDYDLATKIPSDLVAEIAKWASLGHDAWKEARAEENFKKFLPYLDKTVELSRRKAECLGTPEGGVPYDALLDQFEPGMTTARTVEIFKPLRAFTVDLVQKVKDSGKDVDSSAVTREFPIDQQKKLVDAFVRAIGFEMRDGRLDDAVHPFCQGMGPGDVRLTNRYRADGWCDSISSGLHEAGHGVYEQGLPREAHFGEPLADSISLGIHESQSRMWENLVGRSRAFWEWGLPTAREILGPGLDGLTPEQVYLANNVVNPSFIRVEADEVTYNLHIMLRFDLERAMLHGDLNPKDLPGVWNERMKSDFGLSVPNDRLGCLQDIHWSMGAIGYFATYSFGNLYSAQLWEAMAKDIPGREELMRRGEFAPILGWLQEKIYSKGRQFRAEELCEQITGEPLNHAALQRHLEAKVEAVYGV